MPRVETAILGRRRPLAGRFAEQALDDHAIAPYAIELAVALIDADFAEPELRHQCAAGRVLRKDAREQFPKASGFRRSEQRHQGDASHTSAAAMPLQVRSYQRRDRRTMCTTDSITGTSTSTPTTVARAAPD